MGLSPSQCLDLVLSYYILRWLLFSGYQSRLANLFISVLVWLLVTCSFHDVAIILAFETCSNFSCLCLFAFSLLCGTLYLLNISLSFHFYEKLSLVKKKEKINYWMEDKFASIVTKPWEYIKQREIFFVVKGSIFHLLCNHKSRKKALGNCGHRSPSFWKDGHQELKRWGCWRWGGAISQLPIEV